MTTYATLKSGLRVGNFSSPHAFAFEDGTTLEATTAEWSREHALSKMTDVLLDEGKYKIVSPRFEISHETLKAVVEAASKCDLLIVPFPMLSHVLGIPNAVTCVLTDRVNKICSVTEFGKQ